MNLDIIESFVRTIHFIFMEPLDIPIDIILINDFYRDE